MNILEKLRTSLTIIRHSLEVMRRHPTLLVFPVIGLLAALVTYVFFLAPQLLDLTLAEVWHTLRDPDERWDALAPWQAAKNMEGNVWTSGSFFGVGAYYLLAMFVMTFVNVALYSQVIEAMNGGKVSMLRGFRVAASRVVAITAWSLLASTVGVVMNAIQERSGGIGRRIIAGLAGFAWSAASVFVIPVMIREQKPRSPFEYLRISAELIRRVWGEGLIGLGGVWMVSALLLVPLMMLSLAVTLTVRSVEFAVLFTLVGVVIIMVLQLAHQVFQCGLYVYATEGVAPGTFDEGDFERAWTVRRGSAAAEQRAAKPSAPRRAVWPWVVAPAAVIGASVLWIQFYFNHAPLPRPVGPAAGNVAIDLAALDHALQLDDLQAVGLFPGLRCGRCDFSATGTRAGLTSLVDGAIDVTMWRRQDNLYFNFYAADKAAGEQRINQVLEKLRARFPGHDEAIQPIDQIPHVPRTTVAKWDPIPGATRYTIEVDCMHCCGRGKWCADVGSKWQIVPDLKDPTYTFDWVGAQPGRWRVWATDETGKRRGPKSEWTNFDWTY